MTTVASQPASAAKAERAAAAAWRGGNLTPVGIAVAAMTLVGFLALFFRWFERQGRFSLAQLEDWGHAFFVPAIAGYLVWQRRVQLAATTPRVFLPGLVPVLLGIAVYLQYSYAPIPGTHMFQGFAIVFAVFGVALTLLGPDTIRFLVLPICFLAFGVTISEMIMLMITWPMQLLASQGAFVVLGIVGMLGGFQVDVDGNVITVINKAGDEFPLNVAQACSGMRMVVAFVALGAAVALLSCKLWWQRIAVFLLAVPVALVMNVLRVAVLGLLTLGDPDLAQGEAHTLVGTLLLLPGLGLFLGIVWILGKLVEIPESKPPAPAGPFKPSLARPTAFVLLAILGVSALGMGWTIRSLGIHLDKLPIYAPEGRTLSAIPRETESWRAIGPDRIESAEVLEELGTQNYVTRVYTEKNTSEGQAPRTVELHLAYYTDQIDTVPHVPERCFVGGGLQPTEESRVIAFGLDESGWIPDTSAPESMGGIMLARTSTKWSPARGARVRMPQGIEGLGLRTSAYTIPRQGDIFAGYFFIANGAIATSAEQVRLLAFDLTNDYAYYLKVQVNATSASTIGSTDALAEAAGDLLSELMPDIMRCVPDWVEVTEGRYPDDAAEQPKS
ncbi:MAG: exosortase/archaeosortase family protein [Planctomycetota bacterium]